LYFNVFPARPLLNVCSSVPKGAQKVAQKSRTDYLALLALSAVAGRLLRYRAPRHTPTNFSSMINSYSTRWIVMASAVKKTISLPADLARETEALARAEGKTLSAVVQDALRRGRIERQLRELRGLQGYWSRKARDQGILSEKDLERYLLE
jgi:hypothetical protein